jgi:hypothetical protein
MKKLCVLMSLIAAMSSFSQDLKVTCDVSYQKDVYETEYRGIVLQDLETIKILSSRNPNIAAQFSIIPAGASNEYRALQVLLVRSSFTNINEVLVTKIIPLDSHNSVNYQSKTLSVTCSSR